MSSFGPPNRSNDPLRVFVMAAALVAAAIAGSLIGFVLDLFGDDEVSVNGDPPA